MQSALQPPFELSPRTASGDIMTQPELTYEQVKRLPNEQAFANLYHHELQWRERQPFLESKGYMLRPRLRQGWTPSWFTSNVRVLDAEDAIITPTREIVIDATRISDGALVYIKRFKAGGHESHIASMLNAPSLRRDARNHAMLILDAFADGQDPSFSYIIMPFLRSLHNPPMSTVADAVDFVHQLLEGLTFLHENGVAHRDCSERNLLMDASALYPRGFHPVDQLMLPDGSGAAPILPRSSHSVRYYYVDFGISSYFPPNSPSRLVTGNSGREEVPELSDEIPYDPFKVDIYTIGKVFQRTLLETYSNVAFVEPIITAMTARNPDARPTADAVFTQWKKIATRIGWFQRRRRLVARDESFVFRTALNSYDWATTAVSSVGHLMFLTE